jgi:ATP-binding cassette subfamily B protein
MISAEFFLPLRLLGSFFHIAMNGNAAADKIFRLLDAEEPEQGAVQEIESEEIVFDHVNFGYTKEKQVLKDVSFTIAPKSFVALVGESGCGKSTIASLIMGDYGAESGEVRLGGSSVRDIATSALYQKITRVRHDSYLFKGTVLENLRMGKADATEAELYDVLRRVDLYDTIMEKGGLSMPIEEKASNLSGGQKQRLVLARAILHDSDIYIFDEATSNIDVESEDKIMQVVQELANTKLVILISHRLANVKKADQIYVVENGTIVENGTHKGLLEKNGTYDTLYQAQQELEKYVKGEADEF